MKDINISNQPVKKRFCKRLCNDLYLDAKEIKFCCTIWSRMPSRKYWFGYLNSFFNLRSKIIENLREGIVPENCKKCFFCETVDSVPEFSSKIGYIDIYHFFDCNCACVYCSNRNLTHLKITKKIPVRGKINAAKTLEKLRQRDLLDKDLVLNFLGGEPTLLMEFDDIVNFTIKYNYSLCVLSNGIIYKKNIPYMINNTKNDSGILISLDSGSREMYKKVKGVDEFDNVIANIKKYIDEVDSAHKSKIVIKYIILEGLNDTKEEIDKWISLCNELGVVKFMPSIEYCHSAKRESKKISQNVCDMYNYMKQKIKETNPDAIVSTYDFVEEFIKNRSYTVQKTDSD